MIFINFTYGCENLRLGLKSLKNNLKKMSEKHAHGN